MKQTTTLGNSALHINRLGLGCMGMSEFYGESNEDDSIKTLHTARDLDVNFFDTADMYGSGRNERLLGETFKDQWKDIVIATKFGIMRGDNNEFNGINGTPEYVKKASESSLKNLGIETIDLYYMHRKDPNVEIEETVQAMKELVQEGKVKYIGLSEVDPETLRRANAIHPITALQTEYSLWSREPEKELFQVCKELGTTFVAYSPLGRGFLTGEIKSRADLKEGDFRLHNPRFSEEAFEKNKAFIEIIDNIARTKGATKAQIALAWILSRNDEIVAIPGTRKPQRLEENMNTFTVHLTDDDLTSIEKSLPEETFGLRY